MQYEYQRANTQVNLLERTGIRLNDQLTRYTKRVEKMQTIFQKAETRLERNWDNVSKMYSMGLSNAANMGQQAALESAINSIIIGGVPLSSFISVGTAPTVDPNADAATQQRAMLSYLSSIASQAQQVLTQLISNAKEADLEKLHAQQDEQLDPIAEKESECDAKVKSNDALLTVWETRRDSAKERLGKDIDSGISHYGLGR